MDDKAALFELFERLAVHVAALPIQMQPQRIEYIHQRTRERTIAANVLDE